MRESSSSLAGLRRRVARIAASGASSGPATAGALASGHAGFDAALGGGLAVGRVHELFAADMLDAASAAAFAAMLALRAGGEAPLLWLRPADAERKAGRLYAPGLAEIGGDPNRMLLVETGDARALLAAANDAVRCAGSAAVVVESHGRLPAFDLTAGRRLALGAREAGTTLILLRIAAEPVPSVAETRWRVAAAPSRDLEAGAPGAPAFDLELLRWRAGPAGACWRLEWNRDEQAFRDAALSGAGLSLAPRRALEPRGAKAA